MSLLMFGKDSVLRQAHSFSPHTIFPSNKPTHSFPPPMGVLEVSLFLCCYFYISYLENLLRNTSFKTSQSGSPKTFKCWKIISYLASWLKRLVVSLVAKFYDFSYSQFITQIYECAKMSPHALPLSNLILFLHLAKRMSKQLNCTISKCWGLSLRV